MPTACAPTIGRDASKVAMAACVDVFLPSRGPGQALVELLLAAEQAASRDPTVVEDHLGRVRGPDAHLLELLPLRDARRALGHHEARLAPAARARGRPTARARGCWRCRRW